MDSCVLTVYDPGMITTALKDVRATNYALKFCDILDEAQKVRKECRDEEENIHKYEQLFRNIEEILKQEAADKLVQIMFYRLEDKDTPLTKELLNCLLESECKVKPVVYLSRLLELVGPLLELVTRHTYFDHWNRADDNLRLGPFKKMLEVYAERRLKRFLFELFWINVSKGGLSNKQKDEVIDTMIETMPCIEIVIKSAIIDSYGSYSIALQQRSSLQFMKDLLVDYSAKHEILNKLIDLLNNITTTADRTAWWSDSSINSKDHFYPYANGKSDYSSEEPMGLFYLNGGRDAPKEHFWWEKFETAFIKSQPPQDYASCHVIKYSETC